MVLEIVITPMGRAGKRGPKFDGRVEGELVCTSVQPLVDGARALLELGYAGDRVLTMRHHDCDCASFVPKPIEEWAKWTYREGAGPLQRQRWRPYAPPGG